MNAYWVEYMLADKNKAICFEAEEEKTAKTEVEKLTGGTVSKVSILPYPATPRLNNLSGCPSFCFAPETCKGRSSCPRRYACSE